MSPSPVAPQIVGDVTFTKDTPEEGESTTATCRWTGQPEPSVTWYKDGEELVEADLPGRIRIVEVTMENEEDKRSELQIEEVELSDTGSYACNVSNAAGSDSQTKRLEVQGVVWCVCVCVWLKKLYQIHVQYLKYNIIVTVCPYISVTLLSKLWKHRSWCYHWTLHIGSICAGWVCCHGISSSSCIQGKTETLKW